MSRRDVSAILLLLATVAGCARMPPTHYYMLNVQEGGTGAATTESPAVFRIGVRPFRVDAPFDQDRIAYRIGEDSAQVSFYAYHRWAAPPGRMLPLLVARALQGAPAIPAIEPVMAGRGYAAYLDGRVIELEEIDRADGQLVRASLELWLSRADGTEIWSKRVTAEGITQAAEVEAVVERMAEALDEALRGVRAELAAALGARAR